MSARVVAFTTGGTEFGDKVSAALMFEVFFFPRAQVYAAEIIIRFFSLSYFYASAGMNGQPPTRDYFLKLGGRGRPLSPFKQTNVITRYGNVITNVDKLSTWKRRRRRLYAVYNYRAKCTFPKLFEYVLYKRREQRNRTFRARNTLSAARVRPFDLIRYLLRRKVSA